MVSLDHEAPLHLLKGRPSLAADLVRVASGFEVAPFREARIASADFTELQPQERRADLVVVLADGDASSAIIVEIQRDRDPDKPFRWLLYLATLLDRLRCAVYLVVVTFDPEIARWAREPLENAHYRFAPLVVEPANVPVITTVEEASKNPELAVLSALMHVREDVMRSAFEAVARLDDRVAADYLDIMAALGGDTARIVLKALMSVEGEKYFSDFARRYFDAGKAEGIAEGEAKGKAEGEAKGKAEGEAKGKAEGEAKGKAEAVLEVLRMRAIELDAGERDRVLACRDGATLGRWLGRALVCHEARELFDDPT